MATDGGSGSKEPPQTGQPKEDSWRRRWPAIFQAVLVLSALLALLLGRDLGAPQRQWMVAFVFSAAVWHWLSNAELQPASSQQPGALAVAALSLAILAGLWYLLLLIHPAFLLLLPALLVEAFLTLPLPWAIAISLVLALLAVLNQLQRA